MRVAHDKALELLLAFQEENDQLLQAATERQSSINTSAVSNNVAMYSDEFQQNYDDAMPFLRLISCLDLLE